MPLLNSILKGLNIPDGVTVSLTPRADQLEDTLALIQWDKAANYSEVGTGKSLVSYIYTMYHLYSGKKVLVIMPPPLLTQYIRNFHAIIEGHPFTTGRVDKVRSKRHNTMDKWDETGWPDVLYASYIMFMKYHESFRRAGYNCVIADESHAISNPSSKGFATTFSFTNIGRRCNLLLMTATPTPTELAGAYGQIKLRDRTAYGSLDQFERMHVERVPKMVTTKKKGSDKEIQVKINTIVGYKMVDILNEKLMHHAVRRRQKDVLPIGKVTIIDHRVELSDKHDALYQKVLTERMMELDNDEVLIAKNASALRQMALQVITNPNKYLPKEEALPEAEIAPLQVLLALLDMMPIQETKLIIFCHFTETVKMLQSLFLQYNPALIYGGSDTDKNVEKLLHDETCRIGILNFYSGGAGFNLQSVCHQAIVYEAIGSPGMLQQGIGRINRDGQQHPVVVWLMRYGLSLSAKLLNKAFKRADAIRDSLGDDDSFKDYVITGVDLL